MVTDIVFLRRRGLGDAARHADPEWLQVAPFSIEGVDVPINRYFLNHPEQVLGSWTRKDTLYGGEGYSVTGNGDRAEQLREAIGRLPECAPAPASPGQDEPAVTFAPPPPLPHIGEGSFFLRPDRTICQLVDGQSLPVTYGGVTLTAYGTMTGNRLAALIGLRDKARRVLQSQNEGWPEEHRADARRELKYQVRKELSKEIRKNAPEGDPMVSGVTVMLGTAIAMAVFSAMFAQSQGRMR